MLNMELPCDPAIPLPAIYLRESKTGIQTKPCIWIHIAALFTEAKMWIQPKCPSDKWINKMWSIHMILLEYYSAIERSEFLINVQHG